MGIRSSLVAVSLAVVGLSPALGQESLVVGSSQADVVSLDPHKATAGADKALLNWVFNGLVRIQPGKSNPGFIEADLAESWKSNADGTVWTFILREGIKCHGDHGVFTAEDAEYSLKRASSQDTSAFAADFTAVKRVEAVDRLILEIELDQPVASLLGLVSNYHGGLMVCKAAAEELGDKFASNPVGTGPFEFVEYVPQQYVKLERNEDYFRGTPQIGDITYRYMPSDATRDLAFQSGEVDMVFGRQDSQWVSRTSGLPDVTVAAMEPSVLNALHLNMTSKPLDDLRVRQAILHAIDRDQMVQFLGSQVSRPPISVIPGSDLGVVDVNLPTYDPEKARNLLAEAGYPNGLTLKVVQSSIPVHLRVMEVVQAQLAKVGINLDLEVVDHPTYHSKIRQDLSQVIFYQASRFPVADAYLTQFFHSSSAIGEPGAVTNFSHCNVADEDIDAAKVAVDMEEKISRWHSAQRKIAEAVCTVPLSEQLVIWAWKDDVDMGYAMEGSLNSAPHITEKTRIIRR